MLPSLSSLTAMPSSSTSSKSRRPQNPNPNSSPLPCRHSPSATLDLLILLLVLFSSLFLISSSFSYLFRSLSLLLPPLSPSLLLLILLVVPLLLLLVALVSIRCWPRRRCRNPGCRGLRKAMEFDVQLQTEEGARSPASEEDAAAWKEIDGLPWKGGQQGNNPDYECLRAELRRLSPPNGRAVLLFRARCGCPVAKLEAWGPKRGRRHKKGLANLALEGGDR